MQVTNWNKTIPEAHTMYKQNMRNRNFQSQVHNWRSAQNYDYQHWCETCDRGFPTAIFLRNHKLRHQKCNIDGCQFVAHPKIITKHIQMQHSTGIFKRLAKLNNPEDIAKWREERKLKYPTLENVKKREAANKEKIKRGEKMGMRNDRFKRNYTGFNNKIKQGVSKTYRSSKPPQRKHLRNIPSNKKRVKNKTTLSKNICKVIPPVEESRTLKPFAGTASLQTDYSSDEEIESSTQCSVPIEDDEDLQNSSDNKCKEISVSEPTVCSALTSLMCCYESSDEDDNTANELKKPVNENNENITSANQKKITAKIFENTKNELESIDCNISKVPSEDESGPEELKISKEAITLPVDNTKNLKTRQVKESVKMSRSPIKKYDNKMKSKLPSTLLEKLLHKEIQHERNVILQCVRYVVKNKYFENS